MFAGVPGQGAADGAYFTALELEEAKLRGQNVTGGVADIYKCFDQVQRPLVYTLLLRGGVPQRVVNAYKAFLEKVQVHNSVAGGGGWGKATPSRAASLRDAPSP